MNNFIIDSQIHLTNREIEILIMLVTRAPSNKQIARTLKISESMIKKHMSNLLKKYNVQLQVSAASLENTSTILQGKIFVVSGVFTHFGRNDLKKSIEDQINMFMFEYNKKVKKKISYQNETQEVGTKYYLPPEFIELRESSPMWDWWSFGVIIRNYFVF